MEIPDLVSVIVPVRNGEATIRLVIDGLLAQTHRNLEVLISDNASEDSTARLCIEAQARDSRVFYVRQPRPIPASENFRVLLSRARGRFVLFAAHDDLRNREYIAALLQAACEDNVVCVTPTVYAFSIYGDSSFSVRNPSPMNCVLKTSKPRSYREAILVLRSWGGAMTYGLLKRDCLTNFPWPSIEFDGDLPLDVFLILSGRVAHQPSAVLYYYRPLKPKSLAEAARDNNFSSLRRFPLLRMAAACSVAAAAATRGRWLVALHYFPFYLVLKWPSAKAALYRLAPTRARGAWRAIKTRLGLPLN